MIGMRFWDMFRILSIRNTRDQPALTGATKYQRGIRIDLNIQQLYQVAGQKSIGSNSYG